MAIMQTCCCFRNVRSGSMACGVYSLISTSLYLIYWAYSLAILAAAITEGLIQGNLSGILAACCINVIVLLFLLIASIVLIVGVTKDNKAMLIPYMVAIMTLIALQVITWIVILALGGLANGLWVASGVIWLLFTGLNILCLICVLSQYQELRDGRGKVNDVI